MGGTIVHHDAVDGDRREVRGDELELVVRRNDHQVQAVVAMVEADLDGGVPTELIEERVRRAFATFEDATIRDFVPILVRGAVRRELRARAQHAQAS
jgi:hypothetical protein